MSQSLKENYIEATQTSEEIIDLTFKQRFLGAFAALILKLLYLTIRYKEIYRDHKEIDWKNLPPTVFAFWHADQLMMPLMWSKVRTRLTKKVVHMLSSPHADGRIAAGAVRFFGVSTVFGSSSRGGKEASLMLANVLKNGESVGITPDGPKGPVHVAKPGVLRIAQLGKAAILPVHGVASRCFRFKSWDRMSLPLPFSTVTIVFGNLLTAKELSSEIDFTAQLNFVEKELLLLQTLRNPPHQDL